MSDVGEDGFVRDHTPVTRDEFKSEIGRIEGVLGTQIGAVEKTLTTKLGSLKAWGMAALVGGQALAGTLAAYAPHQAAHVALTLWRFV